MRIFAFYSVAFFTFISGSFVNPINFGLGVFDPKAFSIVNRVQSTQNLDGGFWATDSLRADAVLVAKGVNLLTGQQATAPNTSAWRIIDPNFTFVNSWNRGASYLSFNFDQSLDGEVTNPAGDIIRVSIDPCGTLAQKLKLKIILSEKNLDDSCLFPLAALTIMDISHNVYRID